MEKMRTNTYIIRTLQKTCARRDNAWFDEVSYVNEDTYGTNFLLYLYGLKRLPKRKIEYDIKSVTNAELVKLDINVSDHSISAVAIKPQNIPTQIYVDLSMKRPFTLENTGFRVPLNPNEIQFKVDMIQIEHADLSVLIDLEDRTRKIESSVQNSRADRMSKSWEELLDRLNIKEMNF
jgi:hypothetical protein